MGTNSSVVIEAGSPKETTSTGKRQYRSLEVKRRIVEQTLVVGASVARIARAHGVNANQVFTWRRLYEQGRLGNRMANPARLLPVSVTETGTEEPLATRAPGQSSRGGTGRAGSIYLELRKARVRIEGNIDPAVLRLVLRSVLR
jgi:transposase